MDEGAPAAISQDGDRLGDRAHRTLLVPLAEFLQREGVEVVVVNPHHVNKSKDSRTTH